MSFNNTSPMVRFKSWCTHAFAVSPPESEITDDEHALADQVAKFVVQRKLTAPAVMLLETGRPLNFIGSQFLTFLSPFVSIIFPKSVDFERFTRFLEKRASIPCLIDHIETLENQRYG